MGKIEATLSLKFRGLNAHCVTSAAGVSRFKTKDICWVLCGEGRAECGGIAAAVAQDQSGTEPDLLDK